MKLLHRAALKTSVLIALTCFACGQIALAQALPPQQRHEATAILDEIAEALAEHARPLESQADLDPLIDAIEDRRIVLLGEASHGTHEYYLWRTKISKRLIEEKNFSFIAVEGDWASCMQVNRYVKHLPGAPESAEEALAAFTRWPQWMWNNQEVLQLVEWLREYNEPREPSSRVGFYGIDVYGAPASLEKGPRYLEAICADAAERMRKAFDCFAPYVSDGRSYLIAMSQGEVNCAPALEAVMKDLRENRQAYRDEDAEAYFHAKQNAAVVLRAEKHFRLSAQRGAASWNARARNFQETVDRLLEHYGDGAGAIVWAHNTHVGDVRATRTQPGMENIGMHARTAHGDERVFIVGFGTYRGTVLAASAWEARRQVMTVPPAAPGSIEDIMHRIGKARILFLTGDVVNVPHIEQHLHHRAIGVTYNPQREREGNYVPTQLPRRYDAFLYFEQTRALTPLAR